MQALRTNALLTATYLESLGISKQLRYKYVQSGWLESLASGVFTAPGRIPSWQDVVQALQEQLHLPIHVGAKTVFQLQNKRHYLGHDKLYLFASPGVRLPAWVQAVTGSQDQKLVFYANKLMDDNKLGLSQQDGMIVSSLERAAFEQLSLIGRTESFDESYKLFETLTALRPDLVQALLEHCTSVKVKRLFLLFAERLGYGWFEKLKTAHLDLGKGARQLAKGGHYEAKYQLVVPEFEG